MRLARSASPFVQDDWRVAPRLAAVLVCCGIGLGLVQLYGARNSCEPYVSEFLHGKVSDYPFRQVVDFPVEVVVAKAFESRGFQSVAHDGMRLDLRVYHKDRRRTIQWWYGPAESGRMSLSQAVFLKERFWTWTLEPGSDRCLIVK